jgi:hypothetical protein
MNDDPVERRLLSLSERTAALRARPGFRARVLGAVAREAGLFPGELVRSARRFVPLALALALLSIGWASQGEQPTSAELLQAELAWELSW